MFCTLGLSHYFDEIGEGAEACTVTDAGWDVVPELLANTLFYLIQHRMKIGRGIAIGGIERINARFSMAFDKVAIYFTMPFGLPDSFSTVSINASDGRDGVIYFGMFVSKVEYNLFRDRGADHFEDILEEKCVDPLNLARTSCC